MAEKRRAHGPMAMRGAEKPKNFSRAWGKLIKYIKSFMPAIIIALVFAGVSAVFTIIGPDKISEMTNLILSSIQTGENKLEAIASVGIFLVIIYGLSLILAYVQGFIMAVVSQKTTYKMRRDITKKINMLPLSFYNKNSTGDVMSRITNDVDTIGQTLNQSLATLISSVALFVGALVMMFVTNWIMALTAIGSAIIGFVLMSVIMKSSQKHFANQQKYLGQINGHIEEVYSGHTLVKAYNAEQNEAEKFEKINSNLKNSVFKAQALSGLMMPIMSFIGNFGYVAVCIVGAVLAKEGIISFGVIVAFILYVRLFTQPLSQIAQAFQAMQSSAAASERVFEFLESAEMPDEKALQNFNQNKFCGNVEFSHVKFGYTPEKVVIKDFSAKVKSGQKVAIVGPTGAGKTTLISLLMKFYDIQGGDILLDGVSIKNMKREDVHSLFCMVLQDTWLFEGTIKENIVYSKKDVSDEEIKNACKAVGLDHFIKTLPKGYDTVLDDKTALSVGQKQQLTIARAMIENAPMLILDEATSSVDTRTEIQIQNAMDELMKKRTSFVIAHRLSTIKNADIILVIKDGDIVESGSHSELLKQNGFYAELYNSQFETTFEE